MFEPPSPAAVASAWRRLGPAVFLGEGARRVKNAAIAAFHQRVLGTRFYEAAVRDYRLIVDLRDPGLSRQLVIRGSREPEHAFLLERELVPGAVALDLGANIGYYTVMMARLVGPQGRVYAVEPFPPNAELLNRNIRLNAVTDIVTTETVAIARASGVETLYVSERSNWHSLVPPGAASSPAHARTYVGATAVPTKSLWDFIADKRPIDLIRLDLEGYEVAVFEGLLGRPPGVDFRAKLLFETHPEFYDRSHRDMRRVLTELLHGGGYVAKFLVSDGHASRGGAELFRRHGYTEAHIVATFPLYDRAIYRGVTAEDAIELISGSELVHAALLEPGPRGQERPTE